MELKQIGQKIKLSLIKTTRSVDDLVFYIIKSHLEIYFQLLSNSITFIEKLVDIIDSYIKLMESKRYFLFRTSNLLPEQVISQIENENFDNLFNQYNYQSVSVDYQCLTIDEINYIIDRCNFYYETILAEYRHDLSKFFRITQDHDSIIRRILDVKLNDLPKNYNGIKSINQIIIFGYLEAHFSIIQTNSFQFEMNCQSKMQENLIALRQIFLVNSIMERLIHLSDLRSNYSSSQISNRVNRKKEEVVLLNDKKRKIMNELFVYSQEYCKQTSMNISNETLKLNINELENQLISIIIELKSKIENTEDLYERSSECNKSSFCELNKNCYYCSKMKLFLESFHSKQCQSLKCIFPKCHIAKVNFDLIEQNKNKLLDQFNS